MEKKPKWQLHVRHGVIVLMLISFAFIIGVTICFSKSIPKTLAYPNSSEPEQSVGSAISSISTPIVSSQSASMVSSENLPISSSIARKPFQGCPAGIACQDAYPNLYVTPVEKISAQALNKTVYLTFDDGPSNLTEPLLNILDQYKVKATFFVIAQGKSNEDCAVWMKDIVNRGHAIALHSYTHDYKQIYASPRAFLDDFAKMDDFIEQSTGQKVTMFRFPGGSLNSYNKKTCRAIIHEMTRRGYNYYDWNVSSGDGSDTTTAAGVYRNVIQGVHNHCMSIVLMHNTAAKGATLSQVANIISTLQGEGYRFDKLDPSIPPTNF